MILKVQILFKSSGLMMSMKSCTSYVLYLQGLSTESLHSSTFQNSLRNQGGGISAIVNISKKIRAISLSQKSFSLFICKYTGALCGKVMKMFGPVPSIQQVPFLHQVYWIRKYQMHSCYKIQVGERSKNTFIFIHGHSCQNYHIIFRQMVSFQNRVP